MNKIAGIVLIVIGVLALLYGAGTFERSTLDAEVTPYEGVSEDVEERAIPASANLPIWGGFAAIAAGAALLYVHKKSREAGVEGPG